MVVLISMLTLCVSLDADKCGQEVCPYPKACAKVKKVVEKQSKQVVHPPRRVFPHFYVPSPFSLVFICANRSNV